MLAIEYHSNGDVRVVELPVPEIGPGELLVQMRACGICASDVMEWYMRPRAPVYPGHEPVGIVAAVGEGVENVPADVDVGLQVEEMRIHRRHVGGERDAKLRGVRAVQREESAREQGAE